jgi:hypothetical protein
MMAVPMVADADRWWLEPGEPIWQGTFDRVAHELVYRGQHGALWAIELTRNGRSIHGVPSMGYDPEALSLVTNGADQAVPAQLLGKLHEPLRASVGLLLPRPGSLEQIFLDEVAQHLEASHVIEASILRAGLKARGDVDRAIRQLSPRYLRITRMELNGRATEYGLTLPGLLASSRAESARRVLGATLDLLGSKFDESVRVGHMFKNYTWAELKAAGAFTDGDFEFVLAVLIGADFYRGGSWSSPNPAAPPNTYSPSFDLIPPSDLELLVEHRQVPDFLAYVDRGEGGERPGPTVPLRPMNLPAAWSEQPAAVTPSRTSVPPSSTTAGLIDLPWGGVFISYSWDDDAHKDWVATLAARLTTDGVPVILDETHLVAGDELTLFMEQAIERSSHIVIVCTPRYKEKADNRRGGVGYEESIITGKRADGTDKKRFIPVYRSSGGRNDAPLWAQGLYGIDLRADSLSEYGKLLKACRAR